MKLPIPIFDHSVYQCSIGCWSMILIVVIAGCGHDIDRTSTNDDERAEVPTFVQTTDETFAHDVLGHPNPVVVIMSTRWCPECTKAKLHIRELANQLKDKVRFREVDVERNTFLAEKYDISQYPTFLILVDGQVKERVIGTDELSQLEPKLRPIVGPATSASHSP